VLDGYRAMTVFDGAGKPHLWSRNGLALADSLRPKEAGSIWVLSCSVLIPKPE
jgi:hypothetical protein